MTKRKKRKIKRLKTFILFEGVNTTFWPGYPLLVFQDHYQKPGQFITSCCSGVW